MDVIWNTIQLDYAYYMFILNIILSFITGQQGNNIFELHFKMPLKIKFLSLTIIKFFLLLLLFFFFFFWGGGGVLIYLQKF